MSDWPRISGATVNRAGKMPPKAYQEFVGAPPTDPTDPIPTTGATGTYSEATGSLTSTLDSRSVSYDRCHSLGHVGAAKLVLARVWPGFGASKSGYTQAYKRLLADYVDPASGRAFLVVVPDTPGRGSSTGTLDYVRDHEAGLDCLDHAIAAVGASNVFGGAARLRVNIGYSTGAVDALLDACRHPDEVLGVVLIVPNFDLGVDAKDGYWGLTGPTVRTALTSQVGDRAQGAAAALDPYIARNPIDGIARILSLPGAPHVWVFGDRDEAPNVPITGPDRLVRALRATPEAAAKTHVHISQTGDAVRYLHDTDTPTTGGMLASHTMFVPFLLANVAPWTMPLSSPKNGFRLLGMMRARAVTGSADPADDRVGWEVWTGAATSPKTASAGGRIHAGELEYVDGGRRFGFTSDTSQNGYVQVIRDADNRSTAFTAGTRLNVDLGVARSITELSDLGFAHDFKAGVGLTGSSPVTAWADQIGALSFTAASNGPTTATDGDGKALLRFASASSQKLLLNSLLVDPTADFTIVAVVSKTNTTQGWILGVSHHGTLAELSLRYSSAVDAAYMIDDSNNQLAGANGIGGHTWAQNTKVMLALMRKSGVLYVSLNGSSWSFHSIAAGTFTTTGTNTTTIGAGWANGGGAYWQFLQGDVYELASRDAATSESDLAAAWALMKSRWTF